MHFFRGAGGLFLPRKMEGDIYHRCHDSHLAYSVIYIPAFVGSSLNIISLSSTVAIGMVVDDAIVVLENITKHIERFFTARSSTYATNEVWIM